MTNNPYLSFSVPAERFVSSVKLVDSRKLERGLHAKGSLPRGPILCVPIDAPLVGLRGRLGLAAIGGCDMLFFDVQADSKYFCNVASPGDPAVVAAMLAWHQAGAIPFWLETPQGQCGLVRHRFQLNDVLRRSFEDAKRKDFLSDLQTKFKDLLEPGVVEQVVAGRTGFHFPNVQVGFLATEHTHPGLGPVQRK